MTGVDLDGPDPLYQQVAAVLKARVADGTYPAGKRIPTVAALGAEFGVGLTTARQGVNLLIGEGILRGVRGRGVFVQPQAATEEPEGSGDSPK